jgi:hypothetical protein
MDLKSLLIKENSPSFNSKSSRSKLESCFRFPTLEKCRSIEKISKNYSKKTLEKLPGKSSALFLKQSMVEVLSGIKETTEKGQRVKLAYRALELYKNESGFFQKEFTIITKELCEAIFCEKHKILPEVKEWVYEKYDFVACEQDNLMPVSIVLEYWKDAYEKMRNAYNQLCLDMGFLREDLEFKQADINFLKCELDVAKENREDSTKETLQENSVKDLQPKEKYEIHIKGLNDIIDDLYTQLGVKEEIIRNLENSTKNKDILIKNLEESKKKYSNYLKTYKNDIKNLKEMNEKLKSKLESLELENQSNSMKKNLENDMTLRPDFSSCGNLLSSCFETSSQGKVRYLIQIISEMKLKKVKKASSPGIKKKPYTDLPTPYRKQQTQIKNS